MTDYHNHHEPGEFGEGATVKTPAPQPRAALQAIEPEDEETMRQQKIKERRINIREGYGD